MPDHSKRLKKIGQYAQANFSTKHDARETVLPLTRNVIRSCSKSIRAIHRKEFEQALDFLHQAQQQLSKIKSSLVRHQDIYHTGYVSDAQKEYAEASAIFAFMANTSLPSHKDLGIEIGPYLNGLAEAASELRRAILDKLRKNDIAPCDHWMSTMDEVYSLLVTIDFPDAITSGLRRSTDQLRSVLERTRGDLTVALRQHSLEQLMTKLEGSLKKE